MSDITVIVPTYCRPIFIERCLLHFNNDENVHYIVIADGSTAEYQAMNEKLVKELGGNLKIDYRSYSPDLSFAERCQDAVVNVQTKYSVFHADDDFIFSEGMQKAAGVLDAKPDVTMVQGMSMFLRQEGETYCVMPNLYSPIPQDDPLERLVWHMRTYRPTFYSTHRSENLARGLFFALELRNTWPRFFELVLSSLMIVQGKALYIPDLYAVRESHQQATSKNDMNWPAIAVHNEFSNTLSQCANCVAGLVEEIFPEMKFDETVEQVKRSLLEFLKIALVPKSRAFPESLINQSWSVHDLFASLKKREFDRMRLQKTIGLLV